MLTTRCENSHWRRGISLVLAGAGQDEADWEDLSEVEWDAFLRTARRNVILLRCEEGLERFGIRPDQGFREGAKAERERIRRTLPFIGRIGEICERKGIPASTSPAASPFLPGSGLRALLPISFPSTIGFRDSALSSSGSGERETRKAYPGTSLPGCHRRRRPGVVDRSTRASQSTMAGGIT